MKDIYLGTYPIGARWVRVYGRPGSQSGQVLVKPDDRGIPIINIGFDGYDLGEVLSLLLHEAYELSLIDLHARYEPDPTWSSSAAHFLFVMTHEQFGEATDRVGDFLMRVLPKLTLEYKAYQVKKEKLDRKKKK